MAGSISELVMRAQFASYMNTGTKDSPVYTLMGEGFTSLKEAKNPKEYSRQYVNESTERVDVVGYATQIDYSTDTYTNNPTIEKIKDISDNEKVGTDAQVEIVNVNLWNDTGSEGKHAYEAFMRNYAIIPDSKGDGVEALVYSGSFKAVGDIVKGTFDGTAFTPAT